MTLVTHRLPATAGGIARAADLLHRGQLVAFPTETVYGLGARADDPAAVAAVFAAKGRPAHNPLIVHVADLAAARRLAVFDAPALRLAHAFWPGPLTLVLPIRPDSGPAPAITAGQPTVALRIPAHPATLALLREVALPLVGPSANPSGRISPTTAAHVLAGLDGRIAAVLDGGACPVGIESTIIATGDPPRLLRPGGLDLATITAALGTEPSTPSPTDRPIAPGQLASHYAPQARLRCNVRHPDPEEVWIGFGPDCPDAPFNLARDGNLHTAAARLYDCLRQADARAGTHGRIAVAPIPTEGLGQAINDRLARAAAPRN